MKHTKQSAALLLAAAMALSLAGCGEEAARQPELSAEDFLHREFADTMEGDYITAYTFMEHPEDFGVDLSGTEPGLGMDFSAEGMEESREAIADFLAQAALYDGEELSDEQRETLDILQYQQELLQEMSAEGFDYYGQLFGTMTGIHSQLPSLLSDWELRSEADLPGLVALVEDVRPTLEAALDYTRLQQEKGLLMLDFDEVLDYCRGVAAAGEDSAVLTALYAAVDKLELDGAAASEWKARLREAFAGSFLPGYEELIAGLEELQDGPNNEKGLCWLPKGQLWYELNLSQACGRRVTVEQVRGRMEEAYDRHLTRLQQLTEENTEEVLPLLLGTVEPTGYSDYETMLDGLWEKMQADFPQVGELDYEIFNLSEEVATDGVAAYFRVPALDSTAPRQLRVNPKGTDPGALDTFSTVAHEGFPGHMYQYAYQYETQTDPLRKSLVSEIAYAEGWAVYAQYRGMEYLEGYPPALLELYRENELLMGDLLVLSDIGIHNDGWDLAQMTAYWNSLGFSLTEAELESQYRQLQANPTAFAPYYVGYEEFSAFRRQAETELGEAFDETDFHRAVLESGSAPFAVVEEHLAAYLDRARWAAGEGSLAA